VTREVARIQASGKPLPKESKYVDIYREKPIRVAVKVLVPIKEHPKVISTITSARLVCWGRGYGVTTSSHLGLLRYGPFVHRL
jgi:hypothetical protein